MAASRAAARKRNRGFADSASRRQRQPPRCGIAAHERFATVDDHSGSTVTTPSCGMVGAGRNASGLRVLICRFFTARAFPPMLEITRRNVRASCSTEREIGKRQPASIVHGMRIVDAARQFRALINESVGQRSPERNAIVWFAESGSPVRHWWPTLAYSRKRPTPPNAR